MQFVWFILAGYPFISSHHLPMLFKPEMLIPKNSLEMSCEVQRSVDDALSALQLHRVTTLPDPVNIGMHSGAAITGLWSPSSFELGVHNRVSLEICLEAVI